MKLGPGFGPKLAAAAGIALLSGGSVGAQQNDFHEKPQSIQQQDLVDSGVGKAITKFALEQVSLQAALQTPPEQSGADASHGHTQKAETTHSKNGHPQKQGHTPHHAGTYPTKVFHDIDVAKATEELTEKQNRQNIADQERVNEITIKLQALPSDKAYAKKSEQLRHELLGILAGRIHAQSNVINPNQPSTSHKSSHPQGGCKHQADHPASQKIDWVPVPFGKNGFIGNYYIMGKLLEAKAMSQAAESISK